MTNEICVLGIGREIIARVLVAAALIVAETGKWTAASLSLDGEEWEGLIVYGENEDSCCCGCWGGTPDKWKKELDNVAAYQSVDAALEIVGDIEDEDLVVLRPDNDVLSAYYKAETRLTSHKGDQPELEELSNELMDCLDAYLTVRARLLLQSRRRALDGLVALLLEQGEFDEADIWDAIHDDVQAAKNSNDQAEVACASYSAPSQHIHQE